MFEDRYHAWEILSEVLKGYLSQMNISLDNVVVAILPRGWLPVAYRFLKDTWIDFVILPVKKIPSPYSEEVSIGAIAPDGSYLIDHYLVNYLSISDEMLRILKNKAWKQIEERLKKYWISPKEFEKVSEKLMIIVDDGIARWYTAAVAGRFLKNLWAQKVVLAVPICPYEAPNVLKANIDEIICLSPIKNFQAVGQGYAKFNQVEDKEFLGLLKDLK